MGGGHRRFRSDQYRPNDHGSQIFFTKGTSAHASTNQITGRGKPSGLDALGSTGLPHVAACQTIDLPTIAAIPITMNLPKVPSLIISAIALLTFHASAVEYVLITPDTPALELDPRDVLEVVGQSVDSGYNNHLTGRFGYAPDRDRTIPTNVGYMLTGLVSLVSYGHSSSFAVFKITRANEVNAVQPTSVLVIPENSTGNYDIVVETSDDTATWTPFHSQTVLATDPKRFFRTRIVRRD
jgi:hypothetical protein